MCFCLAVFHIHVHNVTDTHLHLFFGHSNFIISFMLSFLINAVLHIPLVFYTCPDLAILGSLIYVFTLDFVIISFLLNVSLLDPIMREFCRSSPYMST